MAFTCGSDRARSRGRSLPPLIYFIPDSLRDSAPLLLKRQCDRTLLKYLETRDGGGVRAVEVWEANGRRAWGSVALSLQK